MNNKNTINHFSLIFRLFGNLFYRTPTDPVLEGVFNWLQDEKLSQIWPLEIDEESQSALENLQMKIDLSVLDREYCKLFLESGKLSLKLSDYGVDLKAFADFRELRNAPKTDNFDHFALLLLTASWLEDNINSIEAQQQLFEHFLLPCAAKFLIQVENHSVLPFYRSLACLTREILVAMADELDRNE
ncbi:molecular chaperone [Rodentibacter caecimuris]|uniref:Molecular chaperone n=1 Tax=Rodentibacter caecimuris TaxID=1796644 RepID=A0ABX3KYL5_9PAST|nr:hypothetical protein BKG89_03415 [Rodentibacter heylii]